MIASTGQALTHAPQSTHVAGSMCSISAVAKSGSSGVGMDAVDRAGVHA